MRTQLSIAFAVLANITLMTAISLGEARPSAAQLSLAYVQVETIDSYTILDEPLLTWRPATVVHSEGDFPKISVSPSNQVFVSWRDNRRGDFNTDVYVRRSDDEGHSFGSEVLAASNSSWPHALLAGGNGNVYVAWSASVVYMTHSIDSGDSFSNEMRIDDGTVSSYNYEGRPDLAQGGDGIIYAVFGSGSNPQGILFTKSTDGGISFDPLVRVADIGAYVGYPSIAIAPNDAIYVTWVDEGYNVYFARSTDGGTTFGSAQQVNDISDSVSSITTDLAIYGNENVYVVWSDNRNGNPDIYYARSIDGGVSFQPNQRLNDGTGTGVQSLPSIAVGPSGQILVSWYDTRNTNSPGGDIYTSLSIDGGTSFGTSSRVNTEIGSIPCCGWGLSFTAFDSTGRPHIVWDDDGEILHATSNWRDWTLMFYIDGDNDLDSNYVVAFNQLESAADNPNANLLVAWDRSANGNSAYYEVQYDTDLAETNPAADYTDNVNRWPQNELIMNDPTTLSNFVQWARANYPAQHYALIISNHGTGLGGLATDAGSGGDWMTVREWSSALATATSDGSDKIDVVFADACLMAMIEDAYQIRNYTDYYVASENLSWIPVRPTSGPYDDYVLSIGDTTSPSDFAIALVNDYQNWLDTDYASAGYTISAVDFSELSEVVSTTNALASQLNSQMSTYANQISSARADTQEFDSNYSRTLTQEDVYIDLYGFANEIKAHISDSTIQDAADGVMSAVQAYVIAESHKDGILGLGGSVQAHDGSHGVSIFFPPNASSFYNSTNYDFAVGATWPHSQGPLIWTQDGEVEWGPMLVTYFNETQPGGPDTPEPPSLVSPVTLESSLYLPLIMRNH